MGQFLNMPKLDMSMEEGRLLKWLCAEGDELAKGDPAFEVETGKVNLEVDAIVEGRILKIYKSEGDVVAVNTPVAFVGIDGEEVPELPVTKDSEKATDITSKDSTVKDQANKKANNILRYDICIIGGGPGGYVSAIKAAQLGFKVALIEVDKLGGTCLNWGCIPTKSLVHHSKVWDTIKNARSYGIDTGDISFSWSKIINRKDGVVVSLRNGVEGLLKKNKIEIYNGYGRLVNCNTVEVNNISLEADNIIIATGTTSSTIPIKTKGNVNLLDVKDVLSIKKLPSSISIVGGGVIGVELACILASFGVKVTIIEIMTTILAGLDEDIVDFIVQELKDKGVDIKTASTIDYIEERDGSKIIALDDNSHIVSEEVLIAVGRKPNTDMIGKLDIKLDSKGYIEVDKKLRTNIENIYAIGDITNKMQLAHVASHQGIVAVENIFGKTVDMKYDIIPNCIFSDPEIACVGMTEKEALAKGIPTKSFRLPFTAIGKALAIDDTRGFVKLVVDDRWNEIVGAHIIGPHATQIIPEIVTTMELEGTVEDISKIVHAHPTLAESVMEASMGILGDAIHF